MQCRTCHHENRTGATQCEECLTPFLVGALDDLPPLEHTSLSDPVDVVARRDQSCIDEETPMRTAIDEIAGSTIGCVLVTDADGRLTGILSERDLLNKVIGLGVDLDAEPVRRYMTPGPDTVRADAPLSKALQHMLIGGYRHLPLVDSKGCPTGVVSSRDIVDHVASSLSD
jgi:CBS domain-containing protein